MSFNKITIVGYLGRDPELRHTPQGTAVCNLSVATTERRKGRSGEAEESATWFRVTAWGRLAELSNQWGAKGRLVFIEGPLRQEEYTDREGGKRTSLVVNASDIQFLDKKGDGDASPKREAQEAAHEFQGNPTGNSDPRPRTLGDLVTPKQLWMIRNAAREIGVDPENYCQYVYKCNLEEISKRAASKLIEEIKNMDEAPTRKVSAGEVAKAIEERDDEIPF